MKAKIFIGNLGDEGLITSDDLRPLFDQFGNVKECECIKNYAFVHMDNEEAAQDAVRNLNGKEVKGRKIKVERSESKGPKKPSQKLFVGNLAIGTTNEELKAAFEEFTPVLEADVIKNYGFVHISADAGKAKVNEIVRELNGHSLNGSSIRVQLSTSGVRQKPGMGGDQCYRCGREGHWSKECPQFPDLPGGGHGGRGGGREEGGFRGPSGRGGPVRSGGPQFGGGRYGQGSNRSDPYPVPSQMRDRVAGNSGYQQGDNRGQFIRASPQDQFNRSGPGPNPDIYERRSGYGGRDMGGPGPMRGPDQYGQSSYGLPATEPYRNNMGPQQMMLQQPQYMQQQQPYQKQQQQPSYQQQQPSYGAQGDGIRNPAFASSQSYGAPSNNYGGPRESSDMFSRRSPGLSRSGQGNFGNVRGRDFDSRMYN